MKKIKSKPAFKCKKSAKLNNTSLMGYYYCAYEDLVAAFGKPHYQSNDYSDKTHNEWLFGDNAHIYGVSLYDYCDDARSSGCWHIGARSKKVAEQFINWLAKKYGKLALKRG